MSIKWLITVLCTLAYSAIVPKFKDQGQLQPATSNDTVISLDSRAATVAGSGGYTFWPLRTVNSDNPRRCVMPFWIVTPEDRAKLWCQLQAGPSIWLTALGGVGSAATSHSLAFAEFLSGKRRPVHVTSRVHPILTPASDAGKTECKAICC
jgi:hypothetical protein